jgi:hypothetical protein
MLLLPLGFDILPELETALCIDIHRKVTYKIDQT